jgi:hypothetical protein
MSKLMALCIIDAFDLQEEPKWQHGVVLKEVGDVGGINFGNHLVVDQNEGWWALADTMSGGLDTPKYPIGINVDIGLDIPTVHKLDSNEKPTFYFLLVVDLDNPGDLMAILDYVAKRGYTLGRGKLESALQQLLKTE